MVDVDYIYDEMMEPAGMKSPPWIAGRPVATPDDVGDSGIVKAEGVVSLPIHLGWSEPADFTYDLDHEPRRRRLYERVLTEGLDDDIRFYIRLDELLQMWEDLWLSPHVRTAWRNWLDRHGISEPGSGPGVGPCLSDSR